MRFKPGKRHIAALVVLALLAFAGLRYRPLITETARSLIPNKAERVAVDETVYPVVPGKQACGLTRGMTQYDVVEAKGHPDIANSVWLYGPIGSRTFAVRFSPAYYDDGGKRYEGAEAGLIRIVVIQCFLRQTAGVLQTGKSSRSDVVARLGRPDEVVYWADDTNSDRIEEHVLVYGSLGLNVVILTKTDVLVGFIIYKPVPKS